MNAEAIIDIGREGFIQIRYLLNQGKIDLAKELAEALHNLPHPENRFCQELTLRNLQTVAAKDPYLSRRFAQIVPKLNETASALLNTETKTPTS